MRDVAERAGVSVGTVSNALNRPDLVADETLARIREAIHEVGFVRNAAARQLRGAPSPSIGLVVLDTGNPFFAEVARGVEDAVRERDVLVILCNFRAATRARAEILEAARGTTRSRHPGHSGDPKPRGDVS